MSIVSNFTTVGSLFLIKSNRILFFLPPPHNIIFLKLYFFEIKYIESPIKLAVKSVSVAAPSSIDKPLQKEISKNLLDLFFDELGENNERFSLLDLGCGTGFCSKIISENTSLTNIHLLDISHEMIKKSNGKRTIPQIFFDDKHIGGYDETRALEKENKLMDMFK